MESEAIPSVKSTGRILRSTGPVGPTQTSGSKEGFPKSARSSRQAQHDKSQASSGRSTRPVRPTQGLAGKTRSNFQTGNKRTQKLPASNLSLSETDSFESSDENTLAALSGSRSCRDAVDCPRAYRRGQDLPLLRSSWILPIPSLYPFQSQVRISPIPRCVFSPPAPRPLSKVDLFGEASIDSDGSLSLSSEAR